MGLDTPENAKGVSVLNHPSRVLQGLDDGQERASRRLWP